MTRDEIAKEFDQFFKFDTDDRTVVTSTSAKLFAEHIVKQMRKGWFIAVAPKRQQSPEFFAPLSYGKGNEPAQHMLLMRGRASVFATQAEAWAAAKDTCTRAEDEGHAWPSKYSFVAIEVTE